MEERGRREGNDCCKAYSMPKGCHTPAFHFCLLVLGSPLDLKVAQVDNIILIVYKRGAKSPAFSFSLVMTDLVTRTVSPLAFFLLVFSFT